MEVPTLDLAQQRVLGALAEKALATPDYYPMTLNALVSACNQKTGRDPVTSLTQSQVLEALDELRRLGLAGESLGGGSRAIKYRHALDSALELDTPEEAALAVLLLRGAQTAGEVRSRTARLFAFADGDAAQATLDGLARRGLAVQRPRQPGHSADRYTHTLGEQPAGQAGEAEGSATGSQEDAQESKQAADPSRLGALEEKVDHLQEELTALRQQLDDLLS